jgi:DNA-binding MarR family transcriptional regulator
VTQTALDIQDYPQPAYRDNFARHLMGVSHYLQASIMQTLQENHGHAALRINFEPYFSMAARGGVRLCAIADHLAISRQAANQIANQIEAAGYLLRQADTSDGRAKLLVLTKQGEQVVLHGTRQALRLERQMRELVGSKTMNDTEASLWILAGELQLLPAYQKEQQGGLVLAALLPPLANYINKQLMELTRARGHPHLKPNFGQVLTRIGPEGGRIQHIARSQNVSKQAIGIIVARLEELCYLERVPDPLDARQKVLHFTGYGRQLISDAVASEAELRQRLAAIIGDEQLVQLQHTMARLYRALRLERDIFNENNASISAMANDLLAKLGSHGARALAEQLLQCAES